jgi:GMP synthase (glutamine-hydrolysing)
MFFHWHGDTFDLPPGARPLGSSALFSNQGFMVGRHGVALQFHAEIDTAGLERWLALYDKDLRPRAGVMGPADLREGMRRHGAGLAQRGRSFLERWLWAHWPAAAPDEGIQ